MITPARDRRASVLVMTLWLLILLGVIGLAYTSSVWTQTQSARHDRGRREAYWAARAGIEKAFVKLEDAELDSETPVSLTDDEASFKDQTVGQAMFSLIGQPGPNGEAKYGLIDECSFININTVDEKWMMNLPGMTEEMAQSVVDWRDSNSVPRPVGAEEDYYLSLDDPYLPRNGAFQSVMELTRVKGWGPIFDAGMPESFTKFLPEGDRPDQSQAEDARTLLGILTAWSIGECGAPDGRKKIDMDHTSVSDLTSRASMTETEARAMENFDATVGWKNPTELLDVYPAPPTPSPTPAPGAGRSRTRVSAEPTPDPSKKMFTLTRVGEIIDYMSAGDDKTEKPGLININTAPYEVLLSIPGMDDTLAQAIVQERGTTGAITRRGQIADISGMSEETFRILYPLVCVRSRSYRAVSRGHEPDSGATVTIEAVFSKQKDGYEIVYWREK